MASELTAELVRTAYRLFLGREPESELAVRQALTHGTLEQLRAAFLVAPEFRDLIQSDLPPPPGPTLVPLGARPIAVEWEADAETAAALLDHVKATWTRLGEERPHWSVLSAAPFAPERIAANEAAFFASGARDRDDLVAILARQGVGPDALPRLFEFGCGLGRVTAHFAQTFASVAACDVSASHMQLARETLAKVGARADLALAQTADFGMTAPFDLWFSRIVLQHNPPPIIALILRRALALLAPGGFAIFQVPTYAAGYRFRLADYLAGLGGADGIEMQVLPQPVVFALAREAGCETLEVLEDLSAGPPATWRSTTFVLRKPRLDLAAPDRAADVASARHPS